MLRGKMTITLLCVLLIRHQVHAVVNKAQSQTLASKAEENPNEIKADERISNYGPPSDDYGPPIGSNIKGPVPVYGPPELVGDQGPTPIYPPPPPDLPPPIYGPPLASYGPPRNIKPLHGPPKQSFGPPLSPLPSKLNFGSLKLHYGPPKQHHAPPYSFGSFRLPKPQYGPPLKFTSNQYIAVGSSGLGPTKPAIPVPFDTYGVPPQKLAVQFSSQPSSNYGPPPPSSLAVAPESQYGPPDLYRPPVPPPGVPAPPTPPDIKYDGWQPIAGLGNQQPTNIYGPPMFEEHRTIDGSSLGPQRPQSAGNVVENPNVPSDSYGVPIHSPEAQDLKTSVKSGSNDNKGLPPPPLPEYEPFHNESPPKKKPQTDIQGGINSQYEVPKVEPLSIVKTVGFELLPTNPSLTSDLTAGLPTLKLPLLDTAANSNFGHSHAFQNVGNDLSLSLNGPSNSYGPPSLSSVSFGKLNPIESGIPLPPPPALDSYAAPPPSSYSPNGPYPAAEAGRASSFSSFGLHGNVLFKQNLQHYRPPGSLRHPLSPPATLIPPRNREPIKFKESIPSGLLTNLNRYLPPLRHAELAKTPKTYLPPFPFEQQLPIHNAPVAFKELPSVSLNSPMAAPNAHYGTPLSFGDFNTPAPVLTYGAPNFGPASSFVSSSAGFGSNLYDGVSNAITTTYGTPVVNLPLSTGGGHDCGLQQTSPGTRYSFEDVGSHSLNVGPSFGAALPAGLEQNTLFKLDSLSNALSGLENAQSIGQLSLQNFDQPKTNLKDSYGGSIGVSYAAAENSDNVVSSDHSQSTDAANVLSAPPAVQSHDSFSSNVHFQRENSGIRAEALTADLSQAKNLAANEVDASQFLTTHEGSDALSLVKGLTANGDGFEVQGSKGTYTLQIQAADGGLGTENSDGSIRHDQVLSNGLLQDILAAIEQPEQGQIQVQGQPEEQQLQHVYSNLPQAGDTEVPKGHYITVEQNNQRKGSNALPGQPGDNTEAESNRDISTKKEGVALFFNSQYGDSRKEIRSVTRNENVVAAVLSDDGKNASEAKSS
ncbi:hypothetical protein QLX08_004181 [Tetragonisca angustula]|uniref:Uncharacterized protein n=1 Tax=Tetragonisca angustula TaxID=166442 RepID=A0AAW1A365_9HYME